MAIDWAKKLEEAGSKKANLPEGDDWFTIQELRQNTGYSINSAYAYVKEQITSGEMEKFKGNTYSKEHNQLVRCVWYRFI
jgi:hypothetical protein